MATPPPPPPPDARACVATTAVTIDAQTPYKMDVPIRLVLETLPRLIFVFPLQFFIAGLFLSPRVVREAETSGAGGRRARLSARDTRPGPRKGEDPRRRRWPTRRRLRQPPRCGTR